MMKNKWLLFILAIILLTACGAEVQSSQSTLARTRLILATDVPTTTKAAQTPATRTPVSSSTITSTSELAATMVAVMTQNAQQAVEETRAADLATQQITATAVPAIAYCAPQLSSQGRLAYVRNDFLRVEEQSETGEFFPVAQNALCSFGWSPDGSKLLYAIAPNPGEYHAFEYWIWDQEAQTTTPLYELVPDITAQIRSGNYYPGDFYWSPDSQTIFFLGLFEPDDPEAMTTKLSFIDLENGTLAALEVPDLSGISAGWLNANYVYALLRCGTACDEFVHFKYPGLQPIHSFDLPTMGMLAFAHDGAFVVNTGQSFREDPTSTVDLMHTGSGVVEEIYTMPEGTSFAIESPPLLSANEQLIAFRMYGDNSSIPVIDLNGKVVAELPPAFPLSWVGNDGILALNNPYDEVLMYLPLDGSEPRHVAPGGYKYILEEFYDPAEHWSPNRRWYAFAAYAEESETDALFIWDVRNNEAILVDSNQDAIGYDTLLWMPDSYSLYYGKGNNLWRYFITTGESERVIPAP